MNPLAQTRSKERPVLSIHSLVKLWNLGETKECGGSKFNAYDIPIDVLIGYNNLCEKYGECFGDGTGASAKCIRGDDVHYKCELRQSGDCSAGSTLSSVSTLITTLCFMVPVLVALL